MNFLFLLVVFKPDLMRKIYPLIVALLPLATGAQPWYVWTQKTPPPFGTNGRYAADCFALNNKVYLAMGTDSANQITHNDLWEYDPATDAWAQKGVFPYQGSYGTSSFVINGDAYIVGGWWRQGLSITQTVQCNYKYNSASNTFTPIAAFPDLNRYTGVAFTINGKGYYGTGYNVHEKDMWEYDPGANTWTQKASMPAAAQVRQEAVGFSIGGYGFVGLGISTSCYNDLWRFDPVANNWAQRANFPGAARSCSGCVVLNNEAFIIGGSNVTNTPFNQVFKYTPATDSWTFIGIFPGSARFEMSETTLNGKAYVGQGCYSPQQLNEYFTINDWWEFEVQTGVGMDEIKNETMFHIYPNPASTEINLYLTSSTLPSRILIFDMKGQKLQEMQPANEIVNIDINSYAPGNYLIQVMTDKKIQTQKFTKL